MTTYLLIIYLNSNLYHNKVIFYASVQTEQACVNLLKEKEKILPMRTGWKYNLTCKRDN
jgi:hypothetical protein